MIFGFAGSPGLIDRLPSVGLTIGSVAVPDAIDAARWGEGPARVIVRPAIGAALCEALVSNDQSGVRG